MLCMLFDDCKANDPQIVGWKEKGQPTKPDPCLKNNILFSLLEGIQIITVYKQPWGNDWNGMGDLIKHKNKNKYTVGPIQQSGHSWALAKICFGRNREFWLALVITHTTELASCIHIQTKMEDHPCAVFHPSTFSTRIYIHLTDNGFSRSTNGILTVNVYK